jgi:hypothetical protein
MGRTYVANGQHFRPARAVSSGFQQGVAAECISSAATIGALENLKVFMAKKAPVVPAAPAEAERTQPLPIPETKFKTIWQVVGAPATAAGKNKSEKTAVAA